MPFSNGNIPVGWLNWLVKLMAAWDVNAHAVAAAVEWELSHSTPCPVCAGLMRRKENPHGNTYQCTTCGFTQTFEKIKEDA